MNTTQTAPTATALTIATALTQTTARPRMTARLARRDVAPLLKAAFPDYTGRRISLSVEETYRIHAYQLCWDDGTKIEVVALRLTGGAVVEAVELGAVAPWDGTVYTGCIADDVVLVERSYFAGEQSVRLLVSPTSKFLPVRALPA